jgi:hypothetical protein
MSLATTAAFCLVAFICVGPFKRLRWSRQQPDLHRSVQGLVMCGAIARNPSRPSPGASASGPISPASCCPMPTLTSPHPIQPVIREMRDPVGARELVLMREDLVPFFFAQVARRVEGHRYINARAATITKSETFRRPFERPHCLIPASGFYEWQKLDPETKRLWRYDLANGRLFAFAGLWDAWKEPKNSPQQHNTWLQSFTVITTEPNELTARSTIGCPSSWRR